MSRPSLVFLSRPAGAVLTVLIATAAVSGCSSTIDRSALTGSTTTSTSVASTTTAETTTTTEAATTTTEEPTTTTSDPVVTDGGVVKVANAANVDLAASRLTNELAALGFEVRDATNAAGVERELDVTKIYVIAGSEAVARSVAWLMGGVEVFPMPTPAWIKAGTEGLGDATVLVMLGKDLAKTELADMAD